jgi:hypothetical protein
LERREDLVVPSLVYPQLLPQFKGNARLVDEFAFQFYDFYNWASTAKGARAKNRKNKWVKV